MLTKKRKIEKSGNAVLFTAVSFTLILLVAGGLSVSNWRINQKRAELTQRIEDLQKQIQEAQAKNAQLQANVGQAQTQEYLEKVARESFNLKKPDEDVVVVKSQAATSGENAVQGKSFWDKLKEKIGI